MAISSQVGANGNEVMINVNGRFDFNDHQTFREAYKKCDKGTKFVLNLDGTEYMDSSALGMLLLLREHAGGDDADVSIINCNQEVEKILTISNFQKLFKMS